MKLSLITLIRNEQDILNAFLNHVDALFDEVFLLDHRSIDHSSSILKKAAEQRGGFQYIKVDVNGHYQKEMSTILMHHLFENGADFVFFLDCDEFFIVKSRNELEQLIKELHTNETIGCVRWINGFPLDLNNSNLNYYSKLWISVEKSPFSKVIIPRSVYQKYQGKLSLIQGNHLVLNEEGNPLKTTEIGNLLHIPIRSKQQMISKVIRSSLSNLSRTSKNPGESYQYKEILKMITNSNLSDDDIRGCLNLYQKEGKTIPIAKRELKSGKWVKTSLKELNVARTRKFKFKIPSCVQSMINYQIIADHLLSFGAENSGKITLLDSESRITLKA